MIKSGRLLAVSAILSTSLILISCGDRAALKQAAQDQARAQARVNILPQPTECATGTPHAPLVIGADPLNVLKLERGQLDKANSKQLRCYGFNEDRAKALR
jgi:hypothetical protein